ncbi:hypothetical protein P389DRAFT_42546 [Cystobasidium minutum MCA 4210]|uniref:uncharacterized protein n=1 Tax=Cystobasidium minutum MCA 4210 TaxID=1397322 RepID=UPI0034CE258A|eukprot:jgi/Rhomi1/42546/CE42545_27067
MLTWVSCRLTSDGDQHPHPTKADEHTGPKLAEGKENSHVFNDYHDDRSLANRAKAEKAEEKREQREEQERIQQKPTDAAKRHGNEPSKGAKIDEELMNDDLEILKKKGAA